MRNFTYRSIDEKENIEAILRRRKRKLNRQQLLSGAILTAIGLLVSLYCFRQIYYTELDGYMHVDVNRIRAPYGLYLDSIYVAPGDLISKGDTLYSYYVLDRLIMDANPNDEPEILSRRRSLTLRRTGVSQQIGVLNVRIAELKKQIGTETHNIGFGLSGNGRKLDLERTLTESEAQVGALHHELGVLDGMIRETDFAAATGTQAKGRLQIHDNPGSDRFRDGIRFHIADKEAFVVNVHASIRMVFFEKEEIISLQHLDLQADNLQVIAYVPIDKTSRIRNGMRAEVVINDEAAFDARVLMKGVRAERIPEHLRSLFARQNTALIAILEIADGQLIPFWCATSGVPVRIRVKNLGGRDRRPGPDGELLYEVGRGMIRTNTQ